MKRTLQVKVVKANKNELIDESDEGLTFEETADIVTFYVEKAINTTFRAVIGYMIVDTIRKVIIEQAKK
jgi:hypothetical protein